MIIADFHTHSSFSTDSDSRPEEMAARACELGLKQYCITDHMDLDFPLEEGAFIFDLPRYFDKLTLLRMQYADRLDLRIGIELGLRNEPEVISTMPERYRKMLADWPFDFAIGSTHVLEYRDPYYPEYWQMHSPEEGVRLYLESILDNAGAYDGFQVYGHLDYILRYLPEGAEVDTGRFYDLYDAILKKLLSKDMGIEVNTSCYAKGASSPHPEPWVLSRYLELGGEILTIGSDAHMPERIAGAFDRTEALLLGLGYRYYTTFRNRKPEFHELGK